MTLQEMLMCLTNCDVQAKQVRLSYEEAEQIGKALQILPRIAEILTSAELLVRGHNVLLANQIQTAVKALEEAVNE